MQGQDINENSEVKFLPEFSLKKIIKIFPDSDKYIKKLIHINE